MSAENLAKQLDRRAKPTGNGWMVRCPAHKDTDPSLHISDRRDGKGLLLHCFAGCEYKHILKAIKDRRLGRLLPSATQAPRLPARRSQASWAGPQPNVPSAQALRHHEHGLPTSVWAYRDESGACHGVIARYETASGSKTYRPRSWWRPSPQSSARTPRLMWRMPPRPRLLYQLDRILLDPGRTILMVEGEKAADAAQTLFPDLAATTMMGGAGSARHADLRPLDGRIVAIVPDEDQAGRSSSGRTVGLARAAGARALLCPLMETLPTAPGEIRKPGWDIADALDAGVQEPLVARWRATLPSFHPLARKIPFQGSQRSASNNLRSGTST